MVNTVTIYNKYFCFTWRRILPKNSMKFFTIAIFFKNHPVHKALRANSSQHCESLINQRCKGQQHMRWSGEGLEPLLQLRAAIGSNDWDKIWKTAVMNAISLQSLFILRGMSSTTRSRKGRFH